jgi:hypothetical protein
VRCGFGRGGCGFRVIGLREQWCAFGVGRRIRVCAGGLAASGFRILDDDCMQVRSDDETYIQV